MTIQKVLITGVAGFIGSNLLEFLLAETDWDIVGIDDYSTGNKRNIAHCLDNDRFELIEDSIFNLKTL